MKLLCVVLALLATATHAQLPATNAAVVVAVLPAQPAASKALVIAVTVPAPLPAVWQAFTTSEGLSTWLAPTGVVDLRVGGDWTARFPGGSTGGGTILSFILQQELVLSAMAPDRFPNVRAQRTRARFRFEARGDSTFVELTQTGWQDGDEWNKAYEYLTVGNAQLMATLHHRFVSGPIDWTK